MESGERVYHTPDSPWYGRTEIDTDAGEQWFCTEREAQDAGWRAPARAQAKPTATAAPRDATTGCKAIVNINTADVEKLETLKGIGPVKAKDIVEYRDRYGSFSTVEDLDKVKGIGEKTIENVRQCVVLE